MTIKEHICKDLAAEALQKVKGVRVYKIENTWIIVTGNQAFETNKDKCVYCNEVLER